MPQVMIRIGQSTKNQFMYDLLKVKILWSEDNL